MGEAPAAAKGYPAERLSIHHNAPRHPQPVATQPAPATLSDPHSSLESAVATNEAEYS